MFFTSFLSELKFLGKKVWEAGMPLLIGDTLFQQESGIQWYCP